MSTRAKLIRLAYARPELRPYILPIVTGRAAAMGKNPSPDWYNSAVMDAISRLEKALPSVFQTMRSRAWVEHCTAVSGLSEQIVGARLVADAKYIDRLTAGFFAGLQQAIGKRSEETFAFFDAQIKRSQRETPSAVRVQPGQGMREILPVGHRSAGRFNDIAIVAESELEHAMASYAKSLGESLRGLGLHDDDVTDLAAEFLDEYGASYNPRDLHEFAETTVHALAGV